MNKIEIPCPYHCQYDSVRTDPRTGGIEGFGGCNMFSASMVLEHYGFKGPQPRHYALLGDDLLKYCDDNGLDRHALPDIAKVLTHFGLTDDESYSHSFDEIKAHLASGDLVIVQGNFTPSGHVIVVCG